MSRRPQLLAYALVALALVGVPADRVDPGDLSRARAERALMALKISTLARDLGRLEEQFMADCERLRGARLPLLCIAYAEALDGIARRDEELRLGRGMLPGIQDRLQRSVEGPLRVAQLRLDEIETHVLRVRELLLAKRTMVESLQLGDAPTAMAAYNAQCKDGTNDFGPEVLLNLIVDLEELAFQAENLKEPGLRDYRTY